MEFVVVYDACVLWSAALRDLLVRLAVARVVQAKWTDRILDETFRSIAEKRPGLSPASLLRTRALMNGAVEDALLVVDEQLIASLRLPDPDDRHVLAAAITAGAQSVVTFNLRDFPADLLAPHGVQAVHPDDFLLDLLEASAGTVIRVLHEQADALRDPPRSIGDILGVLETSGLVRSVAQLRSQLDDR